MSGVNIPTCLWAQTKEAVYVTVDVPDVTDEKISVDANVLKFSAKSGGKQYECEMELFEAINADESKYEVRGRNVFFSLKRVESEEEKEEVYWPRLLKDKNLQKRFVKCDWNRWVDEDEDEGANDVDTSGMQGMGGGGGGGMDMAAMQQMMAGMGGGGGMPGMPGMPGGGGGGGGMDMAAMQKMMAQMGGGGAGMGAKVGANDNEPDSDDDDDVDDLDDMPELE
jgi:hypothetical protein